MDGPAPWCAMVVFGEEQVDDGNLTIGYTFSVTCAVLDKVFRPFLEVEPKKGLVFVSILNVDQRNFVSG